MIQPADVSLARISAQLESLFALLIAQTEQVNSLEDRVKALSDRQTDLQDAVDSALIVFKGTNWELAYDHLRSR